MTIYNFGSLNIDYFYRVPSIPQPGETLAAVSVSKGLGGKGANQSVALARAGADVRHIGCISENDEWMREQIFEFGVDTSHVLQVSGISGHAIIAIAEDGENSIILMPGANLSVPISHIRDSLSGIGPSDWLVLQNETNGTAEAAEFAKAAGAKVAYSAAPFSVSAVSEILDFVDLLAVNEVEAAALEGSLNAEQREKLQNVHLLRTKGSRGADLRYDGHHVSVPAHKVNVVDTTAAGDTFFGFFLGSLTNGNAMEESLKLGSAAAALKVTRAGTADVIPTLSEVKSFLT